MYNKLKEYLANKKKTMAKSNFNGSRKHQQKMSLSQVADASTTRFKLKAN